MLVYFLFKLLALLLFMSKGVTQSTTQAKTYTHNCHLMKMTAPIPKLEVRKNFR